MDLIKAMPQDDPAATPTATSRRYPALTALFCPPLFCAISAPFYAVFGVSHETALLVVALHLPGLGLGCWRLALLAAGHASYLALLCWCCGCPR